MKATGTACPTTSAAAETYNLPPPKGCPQETAGTPFHIHTGVKSNQTLTQAFQRRFSFEAGRSQFQQAPIPLVRIPHATSKPAVTEMKPPFGSYRYQEDLSPQ